MGGGGGGVTDIRLALVCVGGGSGRLTGSKVRPGQADRQTGNVYIEIRWLCIFESIRFIHNLFICSQTDAEKSEWERERERGGERKREKDMRTMRASLTNFNQCNK